VVGGVLGGVDGGVLGGVLGGVDGGVDDGDFFGVGDFVGVRDFVGLGDFDETGDAVPVGTTLVPGTPAPTLVAGCDAVRGAAALLPVGDDDDWVGATVFVLVFAALLPLFEISTAIIATIPMAAAPIPANRNVRDPLPRGGGIRCASFW